MKIFEHVQKWAACFKDNIFILSTSYHFSILLAILQFKKARTNYPQDQYDSSVEKGALLEEKRWAFSDAKMLIIWLREILNISVIQPTFFNTLIQSERHLGTDGIYFKTIQLDNNPSVSLKNMFINSDWACKILKVNIN